MDDSDYGSGSDCDDEIFEAPAVQAQESTFSVLTPEDCEKLAEHEVQSVTELLCCPPAAADQIGLGIKYFPRPWALDRLYILIFEGSPQPLSSDGLSRPQYAVRGGGEGRTRGPK